MTKRQSKKLSPDKFREACTMLADGQSLHVVATAININRDTLYYHISPTYNPDSPVICRGKRWGWATGQEINSRKRSKE